VAAEPQWRVFGGDKWAQPIDATQELGANRAGLAGICAYFGLAFLLLGHGLHALFIAAFTRTENQDRARVCVAGCARVRCCDRHEFVGIGAIAVAIAIAVTHA
jgi:hypothetical protein